MNSTKKILGFAFFFMAFFFILQSCDLVSSSDSSSNPSVTSAAFAATSVAIEVGEQRQVVFNVLPAAAVPYASVSYSVTESSASTIEISNSSANGCVITGKKSGNCVLIAKCSSFTSYLQVNVTGSDDVSPYIVTSVVASEMNVGEKKTFSVSLYGGESTDNSLFEFSSSSECVTIEPVSNSVVVEAESSGSSRITITHPKAKYPAYIMVYSTVENEQPVYMTTSQNVVQMDLADGTKQYSLSLVGSSVNNLSAFSFSVADGTDVVDLISNNNYMSITPKKSGAAVIEVSHPECDVPLLIQIVVVKTTTDPYIDSDNNFLVLDSLEGAVVTCTVIGSDSNDDNYNFSFANSDTSVCSVTQVNNCFYVEAVSDGKSKITVNNSACANPYEIYIVVQDVNTAIDSYYITTSQNVIQMEVGNETTLTMLLTGGNESDKNNFIWTVDDSSVIEVVSSFGTVGYSRAAVSEENLKATALITAKGVGVATIEVANPKSSVTATVKVKVYAKGTFTDVPVTLSGTGLVEVVKGSTQSYTVKQSGGSETISSLEWSVEDSGVASVSGAGFTSVFTGVGSGVTKGYADNDYMSSPYEFSVVSGTEEEVSSYNVLYSDNIYPSVYIGSTSYYEISCSNTVDEANYACSVNDSSIATCRMSRNVLIVSGLSAGTTEIVVSNGDCLNSITLFLTVYDSATIESPYYFTYDKFFGVVTGNTKDLTVDLVGASEVEINKIAWSVDDPNVCTIVGNGETCRVTAVAKGQTTVYAHSAKSGDDAAIVVYVEDTAEALASKVLLTSDTTNYLSSVGKDIYAKVYVTDEDTNRENITWGCDDISMVQIDSNYDTAYIRCLAAGSCTVTVSCGSASLKLFISITETEEELYEKNITVSSILELVVGDTKTISPVITGLSDSEKEAINWSIADGGIATIKGAGDSCYLVVLSAGFTTITLKQSDLAIERQIQLVAVATEEELSSSVVIGLDKSYYSIEQGDELTLKLAYGSNKPSDEVLSGIGWTVSDGEILSVAGNAGKATCKGLEAGLAVVTVGGEGILNKLTVRVAVGEVSEDSYYISCEKLVGVVNGESHVLTANLYNGSGDLMTTGLSQFEFTNDDDSVISVDQADNVFNVKALSTGQSYLHITHPSCASAAKVLFYTADTESALSEAYPLTTDKDHYLLGVGDKAVLSLNTVDDSGVSGIKWSCSDASVCSYSGSGRTMTATAKKAGTCVFTAVNSGKTSTVSFTISVTEYSSSDSAVSILTESIIGLSTGDSYTTTVQTNLSETEAASLVWSCSSSSVVSFDGNGTSCAITALKEGSAELTVKYNSVVYRTIYVYVCSSSDEVKSYYASNIDKRYHVMGVDDTVSIKPFFAYQVADLSKTTYTDMYENNVVGIENNSGVLSVTGLNEGIGAVKVENSGCANSYIVYFEVNASASGTVSDTATGYLTMTKTVYVLDASDTLTATVLTAVPVGIESGLYSTVKWTVDDSSVASIVGNSEKCSVFANKVGETYIRVSSVYSSNILNIRIVVAAAETTVVPYIKSDKSALEISCGGTGEITCSVENLSSYDKTKFSCAFSGDVAQASMAGNVCSVQGLYSGQGVLTISYADEDVDDISIVVSCKGVADNIIYLTTDNNYSIITEGAYSTLSCSIVNYDEVNGENFTWTVAEENPGTAGESVCSLSGSGTSRVCTALNPGTARIKVVHSTGDYSTSAVYPLYLTVKVADYTESNPVYITTDSNVVNLTEGSRSTISCSLKNGSESENSLFEWTNTTPDIITISAASAQCSVQALASGVGRITVSHPSASGQTMDIVVVVDAEDESDTMYITTDSTVIEMKPTDSYKQVNVTLNGGTAEQNTLFAWNILSYESTVKNQDGTSNAVISLIGSQDSAIIKPKEEGTAIIRVTNSATSHYLDIKVVITLYTTLSFESSSLTLSQYDSGFINMETPTGKTVIYESGDESVATVSGTSSICVVEGVGVGTCVISAHTSDGTSKDECIVKVTKNTSVVTDYITTSLNVLSLNTLNDASGSVLTAKLNGSDVVSSDVDSLVWTISSGSTGVVSFGGTTASSVTGGEVTIKPVAAGEVSIIVSHEKAKNDKTIYISVEQSSATLTVSSTYETMSVDDIIGLSCSLTGVSDSSLDSIVWASSDTGVAQIMQAGSGGTTTGVSCNIKALAVGDCTVSCTYGSAVKYISIFVTETESISIPQGSAKIAIGQTALYEVDVNPEDKYDDVTITSSSSVYATVTRVLDSASKTCYIQVVGTQIAGATTITATMGSLSAKMTVTTSAEIYMRLRDSMTTLSDGTVTTVSSPTNIQAPLDCQKVRVHYSTEPEGITPDNAAEGYSMSALSSPKFQASSDEFLVLSYGVEGEDYSGSYRYYFDIVPKSAGYAVIDLKNTSYSGCEAELPVCFTDEDFDPDLSFSGSTYSTVDFDNGIINIANNELLIFTLDGGSYTDGMVYNLSTSTSDLDGPALTAGADALNLQGDGTSLDDKVTSITRRSTEYAGTVTVRIVYPRYNNVTSTIKRTFIVNREEWY